MKRKSIVRTIIYFMIYFALTGLVIFVLIGLLGKRDAGEAYTGDFSVTDFNNGWTIKEPGGLESLFAIPATVHVEPGDVRILTNILPPSMEDNMSISVRITMSDVTIYVDGELRSEYLQENLPMTKGFPPSSRLICNLNSEDAGKRIEVKFSPYTDSASINEITYARGNGTWFSVIQDNIASTAISFLIVLVGIFVAVAYLFAGRKVERTKSAFYLGTIMISLGVWLISESALRQLFFNRPIISTYLSYISLELLPIFVFKFFDVVQHEKYHRIYSCAEDVFCLQLGINILLFAVGVAHLHQTLIFSHIEIGASAAILITCLIKDIADKSVSAYRMTAIGMAVFLALVIIELVFFYCRPTYSLGVFLCIGLCLLLVSTIMQIVKDEMSQIEDLAWHRQRSAIYTIETMSHAIDAKDEYAGGHSTRVGEYAAKLAEEVAEKYGFTEEDINRIKYIGQMHDIGKIGVPDVILNKTGSFTEEEYSLMKKHTIIGYELFNQMPDADDLLDGIRYHHERYDGKGYPDGLAGEKIPLVARILCLADGYDAMSSDRVYRRRLSDEEIRAEIESCAGTQFDPYLAEVFCKMLDEGRMYQVTERGIDAKKDLKLLKSEILENILQHNIYSGRQVIVNPAFVRMTCYLIKLAEKNDRKVDMYFCEPEKTDKSDFSEEEMDAFNQTLLESMRSIIDKDDVALQYSNSKCLLVLFDKSDREIRRIMQETLKDYRDEVRLVIKEIEG